MTRRCFHAFPLLALGICFAAQAQPYGSEWLASAPARAFRQRVADLALIYGDSRGIDPRGLLVTGRRIEEAQADCADVDIAVLAKEQEVLSERMRACRHGGQAQDEDAPAPHHKISARELRKALAARFPVHFALPGLVDAQVDADGLVLLPERQRLGATLRARVTDLASGRVVPCDLDLTFAVRYEASDRTLRAHAIDVTGLRSPALPPDTARAWQALLDGTVRSAVDEVVLHRFTRDDLRLADVLGVQPEKVTVEPDGVEIWFGRAAH